jgi:hypothetical protein
VQYYGGRYGPGQSYLLKALREVAEQVEGLLLGLDERELSWRPADDEWCAKEIVGFLRDSDREDLHAVKAIVARDGARVEERRALHGPAENDYRSPRIGGLLNGFAALRDELMWTLREAGAGWEHAGEHPYRGRVPLQLWVHEISERDLEATWKLRGLLDQLEASGASRPASPERSRPR